MAERQMAPPEAAVVDPPLRGEQGPVHGRDETPPFAHFVQAKQRRPAGPQAWAVVFTLAGLYYVWTRVLGKSLPRFSQGGNRVGANKGRSVANTGGGGGDRREEIRAARERQQRRLETAARAREMVAEAKGGSTVSKRPNATTLGNAANDPSKLTIDQQAQLLRERQATQQKQRELEAKKKKQRQLYLKQKALREKEEEERRKDEELGPGWRYRENPNDVTQVGHMDPQSGSGGGGYKPQKCTRRGG